jgi:hypothetical protein
VVIDDLDLVRVSCFPPKADPPLIVHSDAELTCTITSQLLKPVPWWDSQIFQAFGRIEYQKLAQHRALEIRGKPPGSFSREKPGRIPVGEAADHTA